jgi:hypothetical protein
MGVILFMQDQMAIAEESGRGLTRRDAMGSMIWATAVGASLRTAGAPCRSCEIQATGGAASARLNGKSIAHQIERRNERVIFRFTGPATIEEGCELELEVHA